MIRRIFSIGLLWLWLCFASLPAQAQLLNCASEKLQPADSKALRRVVTRTAGQREISWSSMTACVNRDYSRSRVDVKGEPQPDGSLLEFSILCERERGPWSCNLSQSRSARVELAIDGRLTTFVIGLPLGFDLQRAKHLVIRAHEVAPTMKSLQMCGHLEGSPPDPTDEEWLRASQKAFQFSLPQNAVGITVDNGFVSLGVDDQILQFTPDSTDAAKFDFSCWTFEVVVT